MVDHEEIEYRLGCHSKLEPHHHHLELLRTISSSDMKSIGKATGELSDFNTCCSLYEIYDKNYNSILDHYSTLKNGVATNHHRPWEYINEAVQEMNRLLLNYLASFRTFVDHLQTRYKRLDRNSSSYFKDFTETTAAYYDISFAYRFFYKLRNYVQHCELPISRMSTSEYPASDGSVITDISIGFSRDNLLENYDKWGKVKAELNNQPEDMELIPYLNAFRRIVQLIYYVVLGMETSLAIGSWDLLYELVKEVQAKTPNGVPFINKSNKAATDKTQINRIDIPFYIMQKFQDKLKELDEFRNRKKPDSPPSS